MLVQLIKIRVRAQGWDNTRGTDVGICANCVILCHLTVALIIRMYA